MARTLGASEKKASTAPVSSPSSNFGASTSAPGGAMRRIRP